MRKETKNSDPVFYDNKGRLTGYALACGYCENFDFSGIGSPRVSIYMEHGHIHVKSYSLGVWEVFRGVERLKAYSLYDKLKKSVGHPPTLPGQI